MNSDYIIPCIMTVKQAEIIPIEVLRIFSKVTTKDIEIYVDSFVNDAKTSTDEVMREVGQKFESAYKEYKKLKEYANSEDMSETIRLIRTVNSTDLNFNTDTESLINLQTRLNNVLDSEERLIKLDRENFDRTVELMEQTAAEYDTDVIETVHAVTKSMTQMMSIFVNVKAQSVSYSKLELALKYRNKIDTLLIAVDNVLNTQNKGKEGLDPRTWRQL